MGHPAPISELRYGSPGSCADGESFLGGVSRGLEGGQDVLGVGADAVVGVGFGEGDLAG
jgi:hypothetical protein